MTRQSKSNVFNRYVMHTDAPDVRKDNAGRYKAKGEEWESPINHPEGVKEHRHEYGSSLYETHARTKTEAIKKISSVTQRLEKEAGQWLDSQPVTYVNPKYAFRPEFKNRASSPKPQVIQGGKKDDE